MNKAAFSLFLFVFGGMIIYQLSVNSQSSDWNEAGIEWHDYMGGIEKARTLNMPCFIVVYGNWCGYCEQYARLFNDTSIERAMKSVVAIKIDVDDPAGWAKKNGLDGPGVPRTFALDKNGRFIRSSKYPSRNYYVNWISDKERLLRFVRYVADS